MDTLNKIFRKLKQFNGFIILFILHTPVSDCQYLENTVRTKNIILVTLDGFRWQEVFRGADKKLLRVKKFKDTKNNAIDLYWDSQIEERRRKLMPFIWSDIASQGIIYGNRDKGCCVNTANRYWFSYPGYHEILSGNTDININGNNIGPNPGTTLLETLNSLEEFRHQVGVFSSWPVFTDIVNEKRSGIFVNSGYKAIPPQLISPVQWEIEKMYDLVPQVFNNVRYDGLTFMQAFEYLTKHRPRVLMIALDETDEFGHSGRYDMYLQSANRADRLMNELWQWIQSDPEYRDRTTLIITTDHGRGTGRRGWRSHGRRVRHSNETWIAMIGPDVAPLGEIKSKSTLYNAQIAATMASLLKVHYYDHDARYTSLIQHEHSNYFILSKNQNTVPERRMNEMIRQYLE